MAKDIENVLKKCETCEKFTSTKEPSKLVIPKDDGLPYKQWAIDVVGPMPSNSQKKRFIITAIDFCTRWPIATASKFHDGNYIHRFIGQEIIRKFGTPKHILTDCGSEFVSCNTQAYMQSKDIDHIITTPYHAQANGRIERLNGVLLSALKKLSS